MFYFTILSKIDSGVDILKEKEAVLYADDALVNLKGEGYFDNESKPDKCRIS